MAFNVNQTESPSWAQGLDTKEGLLSFLKLMNKEIEQKAGEGSDEGLHGLELQRYAKIYAGTRFCRHFKALLERGNQIMLEPPYPKSGAHKQAIKERIAELERELGVVMPLPTVTVYELKDGRLAVPKRQCTLKRAIREIQTEIEFMASFDYCDDDVEGTQKGNLAKNLVNSGFQCSEAHFKEGIIKLVPCASDWLDGRCYTWKEITHYAPFCPRVWIADCFNLLGKK